MSVYFALVGDFVKVGASTTPKQRVPKILCDRTLKPAGVGPSLPIELLRLVPGGHIAERFAHHALAEFRDCGEWYRATPPCLARIAWLTQGPESLETRGRKACRANLCQICADRLGRRDYAAHVRQSA